MSISNSALYPSVSNIDKNRKPEMTLSGNVNKADIRGDDIILTGIIPGLDPYVYSQTKNMLTDASDNISSNINQFSSFSSAQVRYDGADGFKEYMDDLLSFSTIKLACCTRTVFNKMVNDIDANNVYIKVPLTDDSNTTDQTLIDYGYNWKNVNVPQYMCPNKYGPPDQKLGQGGARENYLCDDFINAYCMNEFKTYVQKTRELNKKKGDNSNYDLSKWAVYSPICACYPNYKLYMPNDPESQPGIPRSVWLDGCATQTGSAPVGINPYHDPFSRADTRSIDYTKCDINMGNLTAISGGVINLGLSQVCNQSLQAAKATPATDSSKTTPATDSSTAAKAADEAAKAAAKAAADKAAAKAADEAAKAAAKAAADKAADEAAKAAADKAAKAAADKAAAAAALAASIAENTPAKPSSANTIPTISLSNNQKYMIGGILCILIICCCCCLIFMKK